MSLRARALLNVIAVSVVAGAVTVPAASAQTGGLTSAPPPPVTATPPVPGAAAVLITSGPQQGLASPPQDAPPQVQTAIWAANQIIGKPYKYGGGHKSFRLAGGYDCSGTVSWALNGANAAFLTTPLDSSRLMKWGDKGPGAWFTVYTNRGHAFLVVAGLRLDTSAAEDPGGRKGPRWRPTLRKTKGFKARHPVGF